MTPAYSYSPSATEVRAIAEQIRCPTCTAQAVADSQAPIAKEIRATILAKLQAGKNEKQVLEDLTTEYGSNILLRPPLKSSTYLLWLLPLLIFGVIAGVWLRLWKIRTD